MLQFTWKLYNSTNSTRNLNKNGKKSIDTEKAISEIPIYDDP